MLITFITLKLYATNLLTFSLCLIVRVRHQICKYLFYSFIFVQPRICVPLLKLVAYIGTNKMHWNGGAGRLLKAAPPWKVMFLGTDHFALPILEAMYKDLIKKYVAQYQSRY